MTDTKQRLEALVLRMLDEIETFKI